MSGDATFPKALPMIAAALAAVLTPPAPLLPSAWAAQNMVVPDGPRAGSRWDPSLTPYVAEIIDTLGPDSPHNLGAVRKSQQTGISVAGVALVGAHIDGAPARIGYALPTIDALQEFNREKLMPAIEQTPALAAKVQPQTSRSATGSTSTSKRFPGGSLVLINANSAPDLRSKTLKIGIADEVDEWADDLEHQGDPFEMFLGRFVAFHATGDWRVLALSTPKRLGESRIDRLFEGGDQRFFHVDCPGCGTPVRLAGTEFKHLRFERRPPYGAHFVTPCCGTVIEQHEKRALVQKGRFVATRAEGLYPSWHVDAFISLMTTWDAMAEAWWNAQGDETKLQTFTNLWLGLPYEVRGDAPDWQRLMERRSEEWIENRVPPAGLILVAGADVQHTGIWVEVVAFGSDKQSWSVSARWLEGDTTDPSAGAFAELASLYEESFADAFGGRRTLDGMAVDAGDGGRSNQVYQFCRARPLAFAIHGRPGWSHPALGTPTRVDITASGRKIRNGAVLWPVGTYALKATFYADLRKLGVDAGAQQNPPGYCHFGKHLGENYFKQLTSEYLADVVRNGRRRREWKESGPNHLLDCRIYAMAIADYLGLSRYTDDDWRKIMKARGVPAEALAVDLVTPEPVKIAAGAPADHSRPSAAPKAGARPAVRKRRRVVPSRWMQ